ncbi:uncharacterized protein [Ambystoma mexicanum]|uniref:uncharacterized protein n=1 Tax=Ambystoma mexicanum TaxID=8296 RepID=UPI0037E7B156
MVEALRQRSPTAQEDAKSSLNHEDHPVIHKSYTQSGCQDLYGEDEVVVPPRGKALIKTGLYVKVAKGTYGTIALKPGLAHKHSLDVGARIIDGDYHDEVKVIFNLPNNAYVIKPSHPIAQLVCKRNVVPAMDEDGDLEEKREEVRFGEMSEAIKGSQLQLGFTGPPSLIFTEDQQTATLLEQAKRL